MKKFIVLFTCFFVLQSSTVGQICVGAEGVLEWESWNGLFAGEYSELMVLPHYPNRPDAVKPVYKLKSPDNFNNYFGSRIRGFLSVPITTTVTFNVTGNEKVTFALSTDDQPQNAVVVASLESSVDKEQHDLYPSQTSQSFNLIAGNFYYFEILHLDNWGSDHFAVWWKTDLVDAQNWNIITGGFLYGIGCKDELCPEPGTPCDDNDPSTSNDIEDGNCNCFGVKNSGNSCIGERGKVVGYRYDNIPGGSLNDLYEAENFPGMPAYSEQYDFLTKPSSNTHDNAGYSVQAYLTVPVSGNYKFNVTGDDYTILFLSSDESPENRQAHQMLVTGWTNTTEHDKYIYQSSSFIYLEKGRYYYIEINEKESGGGEHFSAFWQTPFTEMGVWKRIPSFYLHDYECSVACIAEGSPCDDGNPFTNNDQYNSSCECEGIPCSGPDCDSPLANYVPFEECGVTNQMDNNESNQWLSCSLTENPNLIRGQSHWIMYDLGERFEIYQSNVWNYNVPGKLDRGMSAVVIDYSLDGLTWNEFGSYNWSQGTGDSSYGGFSGPDFNGLYARYILITSLDVTPDCKGLGKVTFTAVKCPASGTLCNDGDENTFNDRYNDNCECTGSLLSVNDCDENSIVLGDSTLFNSKYSAIQDLTSLSKVAPDNRVGFVAGQSILLEPGFETQENSLFIANIDPCEAQSLAMRLPSRAQMIRERFEKDKKSKLEGLTVAQIGKDEILIQYYLEEAGRAKLEVVDMEGKVFFTLIDHDFKNKGLYKKRIKNKKLLQSQYKIVFTSEKDAKERLLEIKH